MLTHKIKRSFEFLFLLRVEPYLFLFYFFFCVKKVPLDQLIQDKICFQKYNLSYDYCLKLPQMKSESDYLHKKSVILGDVTQFSVYSSLITTIPTVIAALFIGSWTDKYIKAKKYLLIAGAISGICEALILVWNSVCFDNRKN
jgi:F0F1-type ATP synthase assembly protein I